MIEHGLVDSSCYRPKSSLSEDPSLEDSVSGAEEFVSVSVTDLDNTPLQPEGAGPPATDTQSSEEENHLLKPPSGTSPESGDSDWETLDPGVLEEGGSKEAAEDEQTDAAFDSQPGTPITVQPQAVSGQGGVVQGLVSGLEEDQYGLPLPIFTKVSLRGPDGSGRVWAAPPDLRRLPLSGLPVSSLHGAAAASPAVRRVRARLRCRGNQHPLSAAEAPQRRRHRRE